MPSTLAPLSRIADSDSQWTGPIALAMSRSIDLATSAVTAQPPSHRVFSSLPKQPDTSIPEEPREAPRFEVSPPEHATSQSYNSSDESLTWSDHSNDSEAPLTPRTDPQVEEVIEQLSELPAASLSITSNQTGRRRASTTLLSQNGDDIRRLLGVGEPGTQVIEKYCCGGGCCQAEKLPQRTSSDVAHVEQPDNAAYRSLGLNLGSLTLDTELTNITPLPEVTVTFDSVPTTEPKYISTVHSQPPDYVQPHPPYNVFSAPVHDARELTKPGAEKRTFHFDIDVTDYPNEGGDIDFKVGGAIGICPPNDTAIVDDVFDLLGVPRFVRDKPVILKTVGGRWPTIWGEEKARELVTTRREILTWTCDLQSNPPVKSLLRILAEYAGAANEKKILTFLSSAQGQATFCDLRTGPHITLAQLLNAFPSSKPPLHALLSVLKQLMPRFYSLSNDPIISSSRDGGRRLIEIAVSVHETADWKTGLRTGVGSGFLERLAHRFIEAKNSGLSGAEAKKILHLRVPMFRGLMSNPLSKEFVSDGPMMLIGAGVGMAPFRGFILNRLKNANCANKIWLVQGVRDSNLDEIYSGELGDHEKEIKRVVQSRKPTKTKMNGDEKEAKYVQDEVRVQADVVWFVINALDGRVFVCGSSKGMGEGVHSALVDVTMAKGGLNKEQAEQFWERKKEGGQYIAVSCYTFPCH
jgi:sulfite reductase alpha subunit-like flavoprotein